MKTRIFFYKTAFLIFLLLGLWILSGSYHSAFAAGANGRIGFVNLEQAVAGTKEWKKEFQAFKSKFKKEQTIIASKEKKIRGMLEEIKKQGFVLDPKLKQQKEEKFRDQKKRFERYVQDKNEEFTIQEKSLTQKLLKKMVQVIRKIGKEKKLTMVLDQKAVMYYAPENDLTDLAVRVYDKTYK